MFIPLDNRCVKTPPYRGSREGECTGCRAEVSYDTIMCVWMFLEIELSDLISKFEKVFQVDNLYYDYENVWEWIESKDRKGEIYLNVSRSHDWEKGNYSEPINMIVEKNSKEPINEDAIGKKLSEEFRTTIFWGELWVVETRDTENYSAKVEKTFSQD